MTENVPFISLCIPAYKRTIYLKRLLDSISLQNYYDYEVILTDDSNDDNCVETLVNEYKQVLPIFYFKNVNSLGTPGNWNQGIKMAKAPWIKIMHDDDWFSSPNSLQKFADEAKKGNNFIFSAYNNIYEDENNRKQPVLMHKPWRNSILKEPGILLARNIIGPPSVTLINRKVAQEYDKRFKWRVDMEFYIRVLKQENNYSYIDETLVNVGVSASQVTQSCIYKPEVELPEGWLLMEKHGVGQLKNVWVYDAWWRLLRNMYIRDRKQLSHYCNEKWPDVIIAMVEDLAKLPAGLIKTGIFSKVTMFLSYLKNRSKIH